MHRLAAVVVLGILAGGAIACSGGATNVGPNDDGVCRDVGFCNESVDACTCDTTCMRLGGKYSCEISCAKDADCTGVTQPITGNTFTQCIEEDGDTALSGGKFCK